MDDDDLVTDADVDDLNRAAVERSAAIARLAGAALVAVGAVGVAAWLWVSYRTQDLAGPVGFGIGFEDDEPTLAERVDLFTNSYFTLTASAGVLVVGLLTRLVADFVQARVGGSITGFRAGDRFGGDR